MRDCDDAVVKDANGRADRVAVGLRADETEPQAAIAGELIVAEQSRRPVVGRHQQVDVAVAIEVAEGEAAARPCGCANSWPASAATSRNVPLPWLRNRCGGCA